MADPVKVMLVDDHEVVRMGLRTLIERRKQFNIVGEAGSVAEAVAVAHEAQPDVIVMDIRLPDGSGVEATREIRGERPETKVIMLTSYADDEAIYGSIMAGASGYLLKQTRGQNLAEAIDRVARGESLLDPAVTDKVLERMRSLAKGEADDLAPLSAQERKILALIAEGKTNREIAAEIFLSDKTVKNYVSSILSKLNLRRRSEAAAFMAEHRAKGPE
ncbi:MAG TPA: response regulator transcription factor [Dehalococcoidia bacterium]|jgi:DNA-binding NarL/FixJ family response regulator|nr:response regulator transcription factor [Dehalococcoidia bacterium]